jgi:hypothetical protein
MAMMMAEDQRAAFAFDEAEQRKCKGDRKTAQPGCKNGRRPILAES